MIQLESLLVATDLTVRCDAVLQSAARLAAHSGAELHVVHIASEWDRDEPAPRRDLDAQVRRVLDDVEPSSVDVRYERPFQGILVHAADVHADLVVLGESSASQMTSRVQATTAERVVKSSEVPCLVIRSPIQAPVNRYGAVMDGTVSDRGVVDLLADWAPQLGPAPDITLVELNDGADHGPVDPMGPMRTRAETFVPANVALSSTRVTGTDPIEALLEWTRLASIQCLVVTTTARTGIDRLWRGSRAARLINESPCSVLLVPSTFWRRAPIELDRIAIAIPERASGGEPRRWIDNRVGRAETPINTVHVDGAPDVLDAAWDEDADLLVVHDQTRRDESKPSVDATLTHILEETPIPVLVLRDLPNDDIRRILVAVDTGELWYEKFGWAKRLHDRFGTHVTVLHAIDLSASSRVQRQPGGEFVSGLSTWMKDDVESTVLPAMRAWIWERVRLAGLPEDAVDVKVTMTDPWYAIPTLALTIGADLVVAAAHSAPGPDAAPISPIAKAVLTGGTYSVLAVVDRERAEARRSREHNDQAHSVNS
jgi:nucleotide-binding universal stress UspA family protein